MTNEEIDQAAKEYSSSCNYIAITNAENGFIAGANWALTHQWHDAKKELPCEDKNNISSFIWQTKKVLVIDVYDNLYIDTMIYDADKKLWFWESSENKPKYWQIPEHF